MSKDVERITQINDQGEIIGGFVAVIRPKQKSAFQRHFTMNQDALRILAKELTGEQFKVLMLMLADLDYENFIQIFAHFNQHRHITRTKHDSFVVR